jgi:hypothetical protein
MSLRKDRVRLISFAAKMDGVSEEEFRRVMTERYKVFCSLPVAQKYILKDELVCPSFHVPVPHSLIQWHKYSHLGTTT